MPLSEFQRKRALIEKRAERADCFGGRVVQMRYDPVITLKIDSCGTENTAAEI